MLFCLAGSVDAPTSFDPSGVLQALCAGLVKAYERQSLPVAHTHLGLSPAANAVLHSLSGQIVHNAGNGDCQYISFLQALYGSAEYGNPAAVRRLRERIAALLDEQLEVNIPFMQSVVSTLQHSDTPEAYIAA